MNDLDKHRIVVVGAGAIGGLAGTYLAQAGYDVTLTDKWVEHVKALHRSARGDGRPESV